MLDSISLQFNGYDVNKMNFELRDVQNETAYNINPSFESEAVRNGEDDYTVRLSFLLKETEDNPLPFNLDIEMTGYFSLKIDKEDEALRDKLINENTIAIMFPFLRVIIASVTSLANLPQLLLPVINLKSIFQESD